MVNETGFDDMLNIMTMRKAAQVIRKTPTRPQPRLTMSLKY